METLENLEQRLRQEGLERYFEAMKPFAKNAIRITPLPRPDGEIPLGASKFGGLPDLPAGADWPRQANTGLPLSFLCQLNLAELRPWDLEKRLPERGMLYVFYDCSEDGMPWGFDPRDAGGWGLLYEPEPGTLLRRNAPAELEGENGTVFGAAALSFRSRIELPNAESDCCPALQLSGEEQEQVRALEEDGLIHKLLGHSDNVQGGMELECEMVSRGIYAGNPSGYREAERLNLRRFAGRWKLLLQIDSEEELGMMWGDCGRLYFWITEDDLAARRFGKAWLILQCG